jgi:nucleotide-binding universal stress UspA family protein
MAEITQILCPVDLSRLSRHALDHALAIAAWYDACVTVFHVFSPPQVLMPPRNLTADVPTLPSLQPDEIAEQVRQFSGLREVSPSVRTNVVVEEGSPVREILREVDQLPADLVVMGTHGHSGFEALFLGSVTEKVLRSTHVPVLTVPPPLVDVGTVIYNTILCPIEFSDPSTRALEYALTLAEETGARLILLHVVELLVDGPLDSEVGTFNVSEYVRYLEDAARARLTSAVPDEARVWCTPEERVVPGKASRVILDVAEQEKAEIIVMGVHGKGALNRRLFGSTTHHVIREARCPVLTLRG